MIDARNGNGNYNLACLLWDAAERAGEREAVAERSRSASYETLRGRSAAVFRALQARGARRGERVAMLLERGIDAVAAYAGVLAIGAIAVFINERLRARQIEHILRDSGASHLVTTAELQARHAQFPVGDARVLEIETLGSAGDAAPVSRIGSDLAQIVYTSGSTGAPKGVVFTHENLRRAADAVASYLGLTADDRIASLLPLSSVYGLNQLLCALTTTAALVIELSPLPQQTEATLRASGATVIAGVPPLWLQLLRVPRFVEEPLPALRILQNAGGHLPVDAVRRLRHAQPHARLFLQYGLTEAFRSTYLDPDEVDARPDSIGRAIPGAEILVVRDGDTPCAVGEIGELVQRGPTVAAGYWNDPVATERVFRPNPVRPLEAPPTERVVFSGDLVRYDDDGYLYFVGRRDRMIKTLGYRVAPDEIADVLHASGQVADAVVVGEPDAEWGERIVAYVVLSTSGSVESLVSFCRNELPRYMQPSRCEVRHSLPRLASGKYDLEALCTPLVEAPSSDSFRATPLA